MSRLHRHHIAAVIGAALTSIVALADAATHGITGRNLLDENGPTGWLLFVDVVHGLTYATLSWVLISERRRFLQSNRLARMMRPTLIGSLWLLATGFLLLAPVLLVTAAPADSVPSVIWGWAAGIGFAGMILSSLLLGFADIRTNPLGQGGRLLSLLLPVFAVTLLLNLATPTWAHPAYIETLLYFGVALIGFGSTQRDEKEHVAGRASSPHWRLAAKR